MEFKNKTIGEMYAAAEHYYTLRRENENVKAFIATQYTGELLQEETQKLDLQTKIAKDGIRETVENSRQAMLKDAIGRKNAAAEAGKKASLDGDSIPSDIRLLQLPTVLTNEELQTLFDRHQDNPIFVRALQDYENKHNIPQHINYQSKYDKLIWSIHNTHNYLLNNTGDEGHFRVLSDNPRLLQQLDDGLTAAIQTAEC